MLKLFVFLACFAISANVFADTTIKGTLLGTDGKPLSIAHVHIVPRIGNGGKPFVSKPVQKDGSFTISTDKKGFLDLLFTGSDHQSHKLSMLIEHDHEITVSASLVKNVLKDTSKIQIITSESKFNYDKMIDLEKQPDGSWSKEFATSEQWFGYQLLQGIRSFNGEISDSLEYDGGGDYRSYLRVKNGKVTVKVHSAFFTDKNVQPSAQFTGKSVVEFAALILGKYVEKETSDFYSAARRNGNKTKPDFTYDMSKQLDTLKKIISNSAKGSRIRAIAQIGYLNLARLGILSKMNPSKIDSSVARQLMQEVSPKDSVWCILHCDYYALLDLAGTMPQKLEFVENICKINPSDGIRYDAMRSLLSWVNYRLHDTVQIRKYLAESKDIFATGEYAPYVQNLYYHFDPDNKIQVGRPVPDFDVVDIADSSKHYSRESLKGKVYMLDFWAVWCGPCVAEIPGLQKTYEKFKNKNFTILSLSFDRNPKTVEAFRKNPKSPMPWNHTLVEGEFKSELAKQFEVSHVPRPILVDEKGIIVALESDLRSDKLEKTLEKFVK